ncbi:alpha/beta fold hydrolase [Desulfovibrio inopinatus]|uniref:alpha/beta fold hydrolase n=1 Tax=Desulfovibrio inopinatus TaxID=102109 RepID=UPI00041C95A5|nr:alpha/beta hydrolase [Desulfovibrio inopinatus]
MAKFLFVHGAFQGAWVWREVSDILQSMGHETHIPTLSGCGYLHHGGREGIDLNTFIQDISNYIYFEELDDVVLVGHSYSGLICGAIMMGTPHLLHQAILVDTIIPQSNRSFVDTAGEAFRHMLESHRVGNWKIKPWPLNVFGVPESRGPWFSARLCDFPESAFLTPFPSEFDPTCVPVSFITCTATASPFIRAMAGKARSFGWSVTELNSGHCPMVTHPQELAAMLDTAVIAQAGSAA